MIKIASNRFRSIDVIELADRLSSMTRVQRQSIPDGWHIPELMLDYEQVFFDLVGLPKESDSFCRDRCTDRWFDLVDQKIDAEEFWSFVSEAIESHQP